MKRTKRRASAPLAPFTERLLAEEGPQFRAEVEAEYAEMLLEQQLAGLRDIEGVTQAELARRMGVTQPVVARFESGSRKGGVEVGTIVRYAAALGYEFLTTFKKMPAAKMARAQAASARPVRPPTKWSKPVAGEGTSAARRKGPRSK